MHKKGKSKNMQRQDPAIQSAKKTVMQLFIDNSGRPKKTPYYITQLQTLLEKDHFQWITYQAASQLVEEKKLSKIETETATKRQGKIVFLYNAKLDTPISKPKIEAHIKSICKLIDKYSEPTVGQALGNHLEGLVKAELRAQGFKIAQTHSRKYKDKEWVKTSHNLDLIAEHYSGKLTVGVEVKNTLPMIKIEEINVKLDMCDFLEITPVFAVRWLKPYLELIRKRGGFSWIFKTQIYPPGFDDLTKILWNRLELPVTVRTDLPEKSIANFQRWVQNRTKNQD